MALPDWPYAWGEPTSSGQLRSEPADFVVEEQLGFEPDGAGEHCWLWVEKTGVTTLEAARRLARFAGIRDNDISWSGLKDRHAVTRQWFSLHLLGRRVEWSAWDDNQVRVERVTRHSRKLRTGTHRGNRFALRLRQLTGDLDELQARLGRIADHGVPNYFGPQRFGRDGGNIAAAREWLAAGRPRRPRHLQGLWLSSLRSLLFNEALAARVAAGNWSRAVAGDLFILRGTSSVFTAEPDVELLARLASGDVSPSGPLPGRSGRLAPAGPAAAVEAAALAAYAMDVAALAAAGLNAERRALRLQPEALRGAVEGDVCLLEFSLPRGCYATSVVREVAAYSEPA